MKQFKIQFTRSITSFPEYETIKAKNKTDAQNKFFSVNPTFFITYTKCITT